MSELEFRIWDGSEYVTWDNMVESLPHDFLMSTILYDKDSVVEQFTGLTDKNGVKIFEGDVVEIQYNMIGEVVVRFAEGKFNISAYKLRKYEVIGNVNEPLEATK